MSLPVYSRADLSRIPALVVAPSLAAVTTSAVAREFRAADTRNEDNPTVQALRHIGRLIAEPSCGRRQIRVFHSRSRTARRKTAGITIVADFDREPLEAARIGIDARARRDPADAIWIELARKVE